MRKTNAKIEGKKYSKNKITSKKNNLNDYAPLRIPQYTQTNTQHPFVSVSRPRQPQQHKTTIFQIFTSRTWFSEPIFFLKKKHVLQQLPAQPRVQSLHFDWMIKFCSDYTRLSNVYENTNLQRNLVGWISLGFLKQNQVPASYCDFVSDY